MNLNLKAFSNWKELGINLKLGMQGIVYWQRPNNPPGLKPYNMGIQYFYSRILKTRSLVMI